MDNLDEFLGDIVEGIEDMSQSLKDINDKLDKILPEKHK